MSTHSLDYLNIEQPKKSSKIDPETFLNKKNINSAMKTAADEVFKAEQAFNKVDAKVQDLLNKRSALLQGEAAYRGLLDDDLSYGTHSTEKLPLQDGEIDTLEALVSKNYPKAFIKEINARIEELLIKGNIPSDNSFYITSTKEPFLPPFATFPDENKKNIDKNSKDSKTDDIARGIITSNTNLKAIIAREAVFYVFFKDTQTKYQNTVGTLHQSAGGHLNTLNGKLKNLQDTMRRYNQLNPSFPMVVPGMVSATGGKATYNAVLSNLQIASANLINKENSAEANVLLRELAQQLMQHLTNIANTLKSNNDTANINLYGIMSKKSVYLLDNYRILKNGRTMADHYGPLVGAAIKDSKFKLSLSNINKHIKGISTMIKLLSDDGSKQILAVQTATYNKNTAMENLSKLIRRIFSAMDAAFGLSSD
jgi:hypothetical protein